MSLLEVIELYDREREAYIAKLEARIEELEAEHIEHVNQAMRDAGASQRALLDGILIGVIGKPGREA
jgi:hypothetical protein